MRIDPGKMDRLITIEQQVANSPTQTATGEPSNTWSTYKQFWAEKMDVGGRERYLPAGRQAEVNTVFRIHFDSGVNERMRVVLGGVNYDILWLNEIGYSEGLELRCRGKKD